MHACVNVCVRVHASRLNGWDCKHTLPISESCITTVPTRWTSWPSNIVPILIQFTISHYLSLFVVSLLTACWVSTWIKTPVSFTCGESPQSKQRLRLQRVKDQKDYSNYTPLSLLLQLINIFSRGNGCLGKSFLHSETSISVLR